MQPRADYLSRLLISRLRRLESIWSEDKLDEQQRIVRRREIVAKILVVEEGVTDGVLVARITDAIPRASSESRASDRELAEFADFLGLQLKLQ